MLNWRYLAAQVRGELPLSLAKGMKSAMITRSSVNKIDPALEWFNLEANYPIEIMLQLSLDDWQRILRLRIVLAKTIETDQVRANGLFDEIKKNPINAQDAPTLLAKVRHAGDSGSVRSIRFGELREIFDTVAATNPSDKGCCDEAVPDQSHLKPLRHVRIDLRTTKQQIIRDFKAWIEYIYHPREHVIARDYKNKCEKWAENRYLPYFDLKLYERLSGKSIARNDLYELLSYENINPDINTAMRKFEECDDVFTQTTLDDLRIQAGGAKFPEPIQGNGSDFFV